MIQNLNKYSHLLNFIEQALKIHPHNTQKVIYDFSMIGKKNYQQQLPYDKKLINFLNDHQNMGKFRCSHHEMYNFFKYTAYRNTLLLSITLYTL